MIKFYKIILLFTIFIALSTFNSKNLNLTNKKDNNFFELKNIEVKNNILVNAEEIKKILNNLYKKNIFFITKEDIDFPLKKVNFIKKIEVKKKYPSTIIIKIYETKPMAIFFTKDTKYILDNQSKLIMLNDNLKLRSLPSVFGESANKYFINFYNQLEKNNFPTNEIKNFYYFKINRWDVQLLDDKIIKFPAIGVADAVIKSIKLLDREDFENYNIIDLRVDGKIIVE